MQKLIICKGLPASGKTTFSREWVNEDPKHRIRVNRDDIRRMLGPYWVPSREKLVTKIENSMILTSLTDKYSVVVDATNFRDDERFKTLILHLEGLFDEKGEETVKIEVKDFTDVPIEVCIERDKNRPKDEQVGEEVIRNMYNKYLWKINQ